MILLYGKKTAIITPPKTASTTLLTTLCLPPYYGTLCIGPSGPEKDYYDQHSIIVPPAGFEWRKIAIVRHPLQRLVSLWGHLAREQVLKFETVISLQEFVDVIANNLHPFYFYQWNQDTILGNNEYLYVHVENLLQELIEYEIIAQETESLPNINTFNYEKSTPDYKTVLTEKDIEKLRWWWEPDANRFGYAGAQCATSIQVSHDGGQFGPPQE